eukprot:m.142034 g.142034  ORF g.142034 m.142034 type:complete len:93 (-) comp14047_c0_seq6:96-374(-)
MYIPAPIPSSSGVSPVRNTTICLTDCGSTMLNTTLSSSTASYVVSTSLPGITSPNIIMPQRGIKGHFKAVESINKESPKRLNSGGIDTVMCP